MKILAIVLVASLAFVGVVYAMPSLHAGLNSWLDHNASIQNGAWHGRGPMGNWTWQGRNGSMQNWTWAGYNASAQNGTWHGHGGMQGCRQGKGGSGRGGYGGNSSFQNGTWGAMNATPRANATEISDFQQAVLNGDYQTAEQLHTQYGLGGPLFGKLNATTFADYSDLSSLALKLDQELGIGNQSLSGMIPAGAGFAGRMHHPHCGRPQITSNNQPYGGASAFVQ